MSLRIGIDVGGTNTDAVLLSCVKSDTAKAEIISSTKQPTTHDVTDGVLTALQTVLLGQDAASVGLVSIGTTHLINAIVQRRELAKVAVLRLGRPSCSAVPAFADWPRRLRDKVRHSELLAAGGFNYDGSAITEVDEEEVKSFARGASAEGCRHFVVTGVFSPINPQQEQLAARCIAEAAAPGSSVTLSHEIGRLGFLGRENASILNESLKPICRRTLLGFKRALQGAGLRCPLFLTLNDGTVAGSDACLRHPVSLISSGPTNSMRGAAFMTGFKDAVVADVGGTTTDVGLIVSGFPKQASTHVAIGGVDTNFPIPDVTSVALGGGTVVHNDNDKRLRIGPESVGYRLISDGVAFGGDTLTLTDAAVALQQHSTIGDWRRVLSLHDEASLEAALATARSKLAAAVERTRVSKQPIPLILVGGGSVLFKELQKVSGLRVVVPENAGVVNAVGAGLCDISGSAEAILQLPSGADEAQARVVRDEAVARVREQAITAAVANGAAAGVVAVTDFQEIQLPYIPGGACRLLAKAVGPLDATFTFDVEVGEEEEEKGTELHEEKEEEEKKETTKEEEESLKPQARRIDAEGVWHVSSYDTLCLSIGSGLLGCGGGGSPRIGRLMLDCLLRSGAPPPRIVTQDWLKQRYCGREDDAIVVSTAFMGSPTILHEKLPSGKETASAVKSLLSVEQLAGRSLACVTALEIGGMNSMEPLLAAAHLQLPALDADGMGRAFPELQMVAPLIAGCSPTPSALADEFGNADLLLSCRDAKDLEDKFRGICVAKGCSVGVSLCPLTVGQACDERNLIGGSYSRAWSVGDCVLRARQSKDNVVQKLVSLLNGKWLCSGRICDLERVTSGGFARGRLQIQARASADEADCLVEIQFQNEFLLARNETDNSVLACTPDLIVVMDADSGEPIATEELRFGLHVAVMAVAVEWQMRTAAALKVVGPQAFGFDDAVQYRQCSEYRKL